MSNTAKSNKQDVSTYARDHQLDTLFQKLKEKVLKEMPDDPKEYLVQAIINEPQEASTEESTSSSKRPIVSQSAVIFSSMPKSSKLRSSAQTVDQWEDLQKTASNPQASGSQQELPRGKSRTSLMKRIDSDSGIRRLESEVSKSSASIPARKSIHGLSLEGRNVTFDDPPDATGAIYLKQSAHAKGRENSPSTAVRASSSQVPTPSYAAPTRSATRPRSKERHLPVAETSSVPAYAQSQTKARHVETGIHKVAPLPFVPSEVEKQRTPQQLIDQEQFEPAAAVGGPGRKKKLKIREHRRKHKEELIQYLDSVNSNGVDKNGGDEPVEESRKSEIESEVEKLLSRSRRNFGVSSYMKSISNEQQEEVDERDVFDENKTKNTKRKGSSKNDSNVIVYYYDDNRRKNNEPTKNREDEAFEKPHVVPVPKPTVVREQNEEEIFASSTSSSSRKLKNKPPPPPSAEFQRLDVRRQSAKAAWEEAPSSTPISPSATEAPKKVEDLFTGGGPILVRSASASKPMTTNRLITGSGNDRNQHYDDAAELEFSGDSSSRPWLSGGGGGNTTNKRSKPPPQKPQQQEEEDSVNITQSSAIASRSRTSSTSSISDIFASGARASRRY